MSLEFDPKGVGYTVDRLPALYRQIEDRFSALPGMANVSLVRYIPLGGNMWGSCVIPQGHPAPGPERQVLRNLGPGQHSLSRFHRRAYCAWPQFYRAGHCHFAAGRRRQSGFCQSISSPTRIRSANISVSDSPQYSGRFRNRRRLCRFQDDRSPPRGAARFSSVPCPSNSTATKSRIQTQRKRARCLSTSSFSTSAQAPSDAEALARKTLAAIDPNLSVMHFSTYDSEVAGNFNQDRLIARLTSLFRSSGADPGLGGIVWSDVLLRCAAHQRNRHPHGPRRRPFRRCGDGAARRALADCRRPRDWHSRALFGRPFHGQPSLRSERPTIRWRSWARFCCWRFVPQWLDLSLRSAPLRSIRYRL